MQKTPVIVLGGTGYVAGDLLRLIAAHPQPEQRSIHAMEFRRDCCVVFGSEGPGLSPKVLAACDEAVAIPMDAEVDSLNVGSAAAVFLYEAARQRGSEWKSNFPITWS